MVKKDTTPEVISLYENLAALLDVTDEQGRKVGDAQFGVYAFFDYDAEPVYVGQTSERLRTRIRRHLTNQRTDAVAMNVLDPFEVAEVEMWPLWEAEGSSPSDVKDRLNAAEYTVYLRAIERSRYSAVLNEADIAPTEPIALPPSVRGEIVTGDHRERNSHPDARIARRAQTIAALAKVIAERDVSKGLRRTLVTQARRLETLARERLTQVGGSYPVEAPGEETGTEPALAKAGGSAEAESVDR